MKEIKFRMWLNKEQKYLKTDGVIAPKLIDGIYQIQPYPPEGGVLEMFTGFQDSEGKDIYENDRIELNVRGLKSYLTIEFTEGHFVCKNEITGTLTHLYQEIFWFKEGKITFKIIGNIREVSA